jgi:hypothetical protein
MEKVIYPHVWLRLPRDVREHLVTIFKIGKSGVSEVKDMEVVSDGRTDEDLSVITLEAMNKYIGSVETDFDKAWDITVSKAIYELHPPVAINGVVPPFTNGAPTPKVKKVEPIEETPVKKVTKKDAETK